MEVPLIFEYHIGMYQKGDAGQVLKFTLNFANWMVHIVIFVKTKKGKIYVKTIGF